MAELEGRVSVSFEILPIISIPKQEYDKLTKKAALADQLITMICRSHRELLRDIKAITD